MVHRRNISVALPSFALLAALSCAAALAQAPAPKLGPVQGFELRNRSAQPITEAHATTNDNEQKVFTANGPIPPNQGQQVFVPPKTCLTGVSVTFKDGKSLRLDHLNDCKRPMIVVSDTKIALSSAASSNPPRRAMHPGEVIPH